jgi:hypothetical protein
MLSSVTRSVDFNILLAGTFLPRSAFNDILLGENTTPHRFWTRLNLAKSMFFSSRVRILQFHVDVIPA